MPGTPEEDELFEAKPQGRLPAVFCVDLVNSSPTPHFSVKLFMRWNISMSGSPIAYWLNIDRVFKSCSVKSAMPVNMEKSILAGFYSNSSQTFCHSA